MSGILISGANLRMVAQNSCLFGVMYQKGCTAGRSPCMMLGRGLMGMWSCSSMRTYFSGMTEAFSHCMTANDRCNAMYLHQSSSMIFATSCLPLHMRKESFLEGKRGSYMPAWGCGSATKVFSSFISLSGYPSCRMRVQPPISQSEDC